MKQEILVPGTIVKLKANGPLNVLKAGSYQILVEVLCNGSVQINSGTGKPYLIDGAYCKIVALPGKSTLKNFIQYLILYWLNANVSPYDNKEFNGIELAKFVKSKTGRPNMYIPTVLQYMSQMSRANKVGVFCKVRQKSLYFCQWVDTELLTNYYKDTD